MTTAAKQLLEKAMELDEADRIEVADRLWGTIEPISDAEYETAWDDEIVKRLADIDSGKAKMIPAEEAIRRSENEQGAMAKPVEVMDEALEEAADAVDWYFNVDEDLSKRFAEEYTIAIKAVGVRSNTFPNYLHGTKRHLFEKYPYQLVIRDLPDRVQVVAVAHLRRKPGYWRRRMKRK